jgi:hypothetical protein
VTAKLDLLDQQRLAGAAICGALIGKTKARGPRQFVKTFGWIIIFSTGVTLARLVKRAVNALSQKLPCLTYGVQSSAVTAILS